MNDQSFIQYLQQINAVLNDDELTPYSSKKAVLKMNKLMINKIREDQY